MISFERFVLEDSGPVYLQIIHYIRQGIASGAIGHREEVPSRRALSALLGVNPNTIQKAYHMLEEEGIIQSRCGAKSYTNVDADTIERIRREELCSETLGWVTAMRRMGISRKEAYALAEELWEQGEEKQRRGTDICSPGGAVLPEQAARTAWRPESWSQTSPGSMESDPSSGRLEPELSSGRLDPDPSWELHQGLESWTEQAASRAGMWAAHEKPKS